MGKKPSEASPDEPFPRPSAIPASSKVFFAIAFAASRTIALVLTTNWRYLPILEQVVRAEDIQRMLRASVDWLLCSADSLVRQPCLPYRRLPSRQAKQHSPTLTRWACTPSRTRSQLPPRTWS